MALAILSLLTQILCGMELISSDREMYQEEPGLAYFQQECCRAGVARSSAGHGTCSAPDQPTWLPGPHVRQENRREQEHQPYMSWLLPTCEHITGIGKVPLSNHYHFCACSQPCLALLQQSVEERYRERFKTNKQTNIQTSFFFPLRSIS